MAGEQMLQANCELLRERQVSSWCCGSCWQRCTALVVLNLHQVHDLLEPRDGHIDALLELYEWF